MFMYRHLVNPKVETGKILNYRYLCMEIAEDGKSVATLLPLTISVKQAATLIYIEFCAMIREGCYTLFVGQSRILSVVI